MLRALGILASTLHAATRPRAELLLEIAALRQQLDVYRRQVKRPKLQRHDRVFWIWLRRHWPRWKSALVIVKPDTVLKWHRRGYRAYWRWKSKRKPGRPTIPRQHIEFIRRISADHPEWGEDKIALELKLKLGVEHSTSTIRKYMVDAATPPRTSTWKQFIESHADQILAIDFTTQVLWNFAARYVFVVMALGTREVIHVAVTSNPTLAWVKQQLREATAWGRTPRFLLHDNDGIFGQFGRRRTWDDGRPGRRYRCALDAWLHGVLGIEGIPIPYGAPNASARLERFVGTLKRECLDHFVFVSEAHLQRTVAEFVCYYNEARPSQAINGIPKCGAGKGPTLAAVDPGDGPVRLVARPILGGLHHDYRLAA
jgi:putative transposase